MTHHHGLAPVPDVDLGELEDLFQEAFRTGRTDRLDVIGEGEILPVVGWSTPAGEIACKRLPPFRNRQKLSAYAEVFDEYLGALSGAGVSVVPTTLVTLSGVTPTAYAVQPRLDQSEMLPVLFGRTEPEFIVETFDEILGTLDRVVERGIGFDSQLSNWARHNGILLYFDVTTPFLRDAGGMHRFDTSVLTASLPWVTRWLFTGAVSKAIMDAYFERRTVILDLLGNLIKERLRSLIPVGIERANRLLDNPIALDEVERHYARDARLWALIQRLRRWDRLWQLKVRRRPYRQLLPGPIER